MKKIKLLLISVFSLTLLFVGAPNAYAAVTNVANETELQAADGTASAGDTILLTSDFAVTQRVEMNASDITIDGDGYTISPTFTKTDNSNNSADIRYYLCISWYNLGKYMQRQKH